MGLAPRFSDRYRQAQKTTATAIQTTVEQVRDRSERSALQMGMTPFPRLRTAQSTSDDPSSSRFLPNRRHPEIIHRTAFEEAESDWSRQVGSWPRIVYKSAMMASRGTPLRRAMARNMDWSAPGRSGHRGSGHNRGVVLSPGGKHPLAQKLIPEQELQRARGLVVVIAPA